MPEPFAAHLSKRAEAKTFGNPLLVLRSVRRGRQMGYRTPVGRPRPRDKVLIGTMHAQ
jgi:hypothetical protein